MAKEPKLTDDLATLAEDERARLGEPPTAEQLLAYRDGKLPEAEAERFRDRLAIDPEWASIYLDLLRSSDPGSSDDESAEGQEAAGVDEAWRSFSARLERGEAARLHPGAPSSELRPRRRSWGPLLLAAMVVLGLGVGWLLLERTASERLPSGEYHVVQFGHDILRDPYVRLSSEDVGIEFRIDRGLLFDPPARVRVEISDASDQPVWNKQIALESDSDLIFRVSRNVFELGRGYELVVLAASPSPDRLFPPKSFIPVLAAPRGISSESGADPLTAAGILETDPCERLDAELNGTAKIYEKGDFKTAARRWADHIEASLDENCPFQQARAYSALGLLASREWHLLESLKLFDRGKEALRSAEEAGLWTREIPRVAGALELNQGMAFFRLGRLEHARDVSVRLRALNRSHGVGPKVLAEGLLLSARANRGLGDAKQAMAAVREGLDLIGSDQPKLRASLWQEEARIFLEAERLQMASGALDRALEELEGLEEPKARADVMVDLAELELRRGNWDRCLQRVEETLELAAAGSPDLSLEGQARHLRSVALFRRGDLEGSIRSEDAGLAMLEANRGAWRDLGLRFFALRHEYRRHRLDLAVATGRPEAAWSVFENTRARGLLESLRMHPDESVPAASERADEELEARRALIAAIRQLDGWDSATGREGRDLLEARVRARQRDFDQLLADQLLAAGRSLPQVMGPRRAQEMLDTETLGLVFASGAQKIHLLLLARDRELELITLPADRQQIAKLGRRLLRSLEPQAAEEIRAELEPIVRELSRHLLGPLGDRLEGFHRLVIVADEPLEGLPFDVLREPRSGQRLIASHQISILPSFSALHSLQQRAATCPPAESELLAMADGVFSSRDSRWPEGVMDPRSADEVLALVRVPASAVEARSIADLYPPQPTLLLGREATRSRFLAEASKHRVLHLASHARSDARMPDLSKIAFSCIGPDGLAVETCDLYFPEVVNGLELCGQLVVLSACTTAGGESVAGEGILGLPRAFLRAGASAVVASHGRVADEPTARLMRAFHSHLREYGDAASALRQAKLDMIAAGEPPSAWAAFSLLGDWRTEIPLSTFSTGSGPIKRNPR